MPVFSDSVCEEGNTRHQGIWNIFNYFSALFILLTCTFSKPLSPEYRTSSPAAPCHSCNLGRVSSPAFSAFIRSFVSVKLSLAWCMLTPCMATYLSASSDWITSRPPTFLLLPILVALTLSSSSLCFFCLPYLCTINLVEWPSHSLTHRPIGKHTLVPTVQTQHMWPLSVSCIRLIICQTLGFMSHVH